MHERWSRYKNPIRPRHTLRLLLHHALRQPGPGRPGRGRGAAGHRGGQEAGAGLHHGQGREDVTMGRGEDQQIIPVCIDNRWIHGLL